MTPKRPTSAGWVRTGKIREPVTNTVGEVWCHEGGLKVITSVDPIKEDNPYFHVSATFHTSRWKKRTCTDREMKKVRADFDMRRAEEFRDKPSDVARNLFLPV